jgi:hypothetical protein
MRSTSTEIRSRVHRSRPGTFFAVSDYPAAKRIAAETALSRLHSEGKLERVRRGLYMKGAKSRFGSVRPTSETVLRRIASGRGFGPTGWSASNALGVSTQVPARPSFVVVGSVPTGFADVDISTRFNLGRASLKPLEVAVLEVLRNYPRFVEVSWDELRHRIRELDRTERIRLGHIAKAAVTERPARLAELLDEIASAEPVAA